VIVLNSKKKNLFQTLLIRVNKINVTQMTVTHSRLKFSPISNVHTNSMRKIEIKGNHKLDEKTILTSWTLLIAEKLLKGYYLVLTVSELS